MLSWSRQYMRWPMRTPNQQRTVRSRPSCDLRVPDCRVEVPGASGGARSLAVYLWLSST